MKINYSSLYLSSSPVLKALSMLGVVLCIRDITSSVIRNLGSVSLKHWKHWDSLDSVHLFNGLSLDSKAYCFPWHRLVIFFEGFLILIAGYENNLELLAILVHLFVELGKDWGEASAWWAPMGTKVNSDEFGSLAGLGEWHFSVFGHHVFDSWKVGLHS